MVRSEITGTTFVYAKEGQYGYFRLDDKPLTIDGSVIAETVEVKTK